MIQGNEPALAVRRHAGIEVEGQGITIEIQPCADENSNGPLVSVNVIAKPALTGFDRGCRLSHELHDDFTLDDISVDDALLTCLAPSPSAPAYRQGFSVALESGMAALVRQALPRIARVSALASAAVRAVGERMPPPDDGALCLWPHHRDIIKQLVADVLLDGSEFGRMLEVELAPYTGDETPFRAAITDPAVRRLIESHKD